MLREWKRSSPIVEAPTLRFTSGGITGRRSRSEVVDSSTAPKRCSCLVTMIFRARTQWRESVRSTVAKLDTVGNEDFFCRFEYNSSTGAFNPDRVAVYCKCEMPYNPENLMVQCEDCNDWFHPSCIYMNIEEAKRLEHFFCESCSSGGRKKLHNSHATSRHSDVKVEAKRRRR